MARRRIALWAMVVTAMVVTCGTGMAAFMPVTPVPGNNGLNPELYADSMLASMSIQRQFAKTLPSVADYSQTAHKQSHTDENCAIVDRNWVMWDTPWLDFETRKAEDGSFGYDVNSSGFATGFGKLFGSRSTLGIAVGYDARKLSGRNDVGVRDKGEAFHSALYGGTSWGCLFVDGYAGYSYTRHRATRNGLDIDPLVGYIPYSVGSNYSEDIWSAGMKASYVLGLPGNFRLVPSVGLDYSHVRRRGFTEYDKDPFGVSSALTVDQSSFNNVEMPLMVSLNRTFRSSFLRFGGACSMWTPEVRGGWIPNFGSRNTTADAVIDGFYTSAESAELQRSYGTVGAGLKIQIRDKYIFAVDYDYYFASNYDRHSITGTYGVAF